MPALHQKPPTVVWASCPNEQKTNCNTGGQNARTTSKTTDGSVGIPARTNKKLVVTPAGRMPALHQKPPTVAWASCPNEQKPVATSAKTSCNIAGRMPALHKKPPTVVWASCPNEQKLIATLAGRMPALHQKPPSVVWASLPERTKN
jgi:hypothetical protein